MNPLFGDERRRKINLGGASIASSHSAILGEARAKRNERLEQKRRHENAVKVQAWWRGLAEAKSNRLEMRKAFEADVLSLMGLRCLVLIGSTDEEALGIWSGRLAASGTDALFELATNGDLQSKTSWLILIRQVSILLLRSVSKSPKSERATAHLKILNSLFSISTTSKYLGTSATQVTMDITRYALSRDFYRLISDAIKTIPSASRNSPSLPLLISLSMSPLETFPTACPEFNHIFTRLFSSILTIPLLPNRLPVPTLTFLSSHIPFNSMITAEINYIVTATTPEAKVHLVANLQVLIPPRYKVLRSDALTAYIHLLVILLNEIPTKSLNPLKRPSNANAADKYTNQEDSDSGSDTEQHSSTRPRVSIVSSFSAPPPPPIPELDPKTLKRLSTLPSPSHIASLLSSASGLRALPALLFALSTIWPNVLSAVLAAPGGPGLLRQVYRTDVRQAALGREGVQLTDPAYADLWPPLLFLTDLYAKALVTMGDDEFFGTAGGDANFPGSQVLGGSSSSGSHINAVGVGKGDASAPPPRNPLTLDELTSFSRQLLNIAFALYWLEDSSAMTATVAPGVRCTWEGVREKVTKCLVGIHARDSRKPFVPSDHWLVTSQINMQSFIEAAIFEERELSSSTPSTTIITGPSRRPQQIHSKRQLAYLSPRLGVLNNIPFAIPFDIRVSIFRHFVLNDAMSRPSSSRARHGWSFDGMGGVGKTRVQVRRGNVAEDGFDRLAEADLKGPVEITFIDQFGAEEAGIDGGGVFKEFFTSLCKEVFDTDRGLWLANKKNELYPNPHAYATEGHSLNWYRFIGRILGKAMYEGILVDVAFAGFFLAKWLGKQSFLDDLASLDPDLYNGLIFLKHYTGNLEDLALNFTVAIDDFGVAKTLDLVPDGSNIAVTRENRLQYIYLVSHYRLTKQIKLQSEAFFDGLSEMIDTKWIRMFNQQEIQILLGGVNAPIDFTDLRRHTNYGGLYDDNHETIVAFWNVVESFDQEQRMALLRFVTSCSRPPLLGFKELLPNFSIRDSGADQHRLPTSSTCVNLLKLPRYKTEKVLHDKLLQAITSNAGFDLS